MRPTISVIIVNRNTQPLLAECLAAVDTTIPPMTYETIVVDNGSRDGSVPFLKSREPQVRLIENKRNTGFAHAVNQAISVATGVYLLILNTDIILPATAVASMVTFMEQTPDAGIIGGQLLNTDGTNQQSIAPYPSLATELLNKSILRLLFPKKYYHKNSVYQAPVAVETLVGAAVLVRKTSIERIGLMDERFFLYFEETDWCRRFNQAGEKVYFLPTVKIEHKQGQSTPPSLKIRAQIEYYISRYKYFNKYHSTPTQILLYWGLITKLIVEIISNFLVSCVTLFLVKSSQNKMKTSWSILRWHWQGRPQNAGLSELE
ncbi:MAG: glycosyltransferase family 2 protein [bacterium]|nr:glycosyltransferase family 2 protein [bacterium]